MARLALLGFVFGLPRLAALHVGDCRSSAGVCEELKQEGAGSVATELLQRSSTPRRAEAALQGPPSCTTTLHFLFLADQDVLHADIWQSFFADAGACPPKIWLHCQDADACASSEFVQRLPAAQIVPTVPSVYCKDLVTPTRQALSLALEASSPADKFLVLSDSTLPLKPLRFVYQELVKSENSELCVKPLCPKGFCRKDPEQRWFWKVGFVTKADKVVSLPMTSQFAVLNRRDAMKFVEAWGPVGARPWVNMTATSGNKKGIPTEKPIWSMNILDETGAVVGRARLDDFRGYPTCADEDVYFTVLYGAVQLPENASVEIPGFGTLSGDPQFWESPQGKCRTWYSFPAESLDNRALEIMILQDEGSIFKQTVPWKPSHASSFGSLSPHAMRLLAASEWLFARKFQPDANLSGFADIVFH